MDDPSSRREPEPTSRVTPKALYSETVSGYTFSPRIRTGIAAGPNLQLTGLTSLYSHFPLCSRRRRCISGSGRPSARLCVAIVCHRCRRYPLEKYDSCMVLQVPCERYRNGSSLLCPFCRSRFFKASIWRRSPVRGSNRQFRYSATCRRALYVISSLLLRTSRFCVLRAGIHVPLWNGCHRCPFGPIMWFDRHRHRQI